MNRKLGLIAAATLASIVGFTATAGAETVSGAAGNPNQTEVREWTLTGTQTCAVAATGTWSVAWRLELLGGDDGAGTVITTHTTDTGTTVGFPNIPVGAVPAYDSLGSTTGITAATVKLSLAFTLTPDGVPYYNDLNNNNIQDATELDQYDPSVMNPNSPLFSKPSPGWAFDPQITTLTVAKPAGCVPGVTVPTTPTVPTTAKATVAPTAATTVAVTVAAAAALPATGNHTNRLAVLAALAVMAGAGFFTAAKPLSARRRSVG